MGNKKGNVSLPSHNTYMCIIVVLVKKEKLLASIQPMSNKKRNVSLPFPQHIYMYKKRCVSKRSETSRFHTGNGQQEAKCFASFPQHIYMYYCCVSKKSETSRFHTANGQQEAKCFASIPTTHMYSAIVVLVKEAKLLASIYRQWATRKEMFRFLPTTHIYVLLLC
jgi:hypothetical protein